MKLTWNIFETALEVAQKFTKDYFIFETCFEEKDPTAFQLYWTVTLRGKHKERITYI